MLLPEETIRNPIGLLVQLRHSGLIGNQFRHRGIAIGHEHQASVGKYPANDSEKSWRDRTFDIRG
jgi:hypothetical protein